MDQPPIADGRNIPSDIEKIARAIDGALVLGVRRKREMPLRSKMGNTLTCLTFALVSHRWISDTQTGLRGIPQSFLEVCRQLEGDRYEYEMHMLLEACRRGLPIREVEIETVYIDNNRGSHFHTLRDGKRITACCWAGKKKLRGREKETLVCYTNISTPVLPTERGICFLPSTYFEPFHRVQKLFLLLYRTNPLPIPRCHFLPAMKENLVDVI